MDVFATAVMAGDMILTYLDACASYSDEAKSLYHRFKWDLRVLKEISAYFERRQSQHSGTWLPPDDDTLLNETAEYLAALVGKVSSSLAKIQASGLLRKTINQGLWVARRNSLKELEEELNEWTNRFDVRLLGLPSELKTIIPVVSATSEDRILPTCLLESNSRMHQFATLALKAKEQHIAQLLRDPPHQLLREIEENPDSVRRAFQLESQELILTSRPFPPGVNPGTTEFQMVVSDLGELAAALHILDPSSDVSLLKVEYFFYDIRTKRFLFVQVPSYPISELLTLEDMIERAPYSNILTTRKPWLPLNQRLRLAKKLAEAVFFLHTAGFVHKNITPTSIISLQRSDVPHSARFPFSVGEPYITGFDMIRSKDGISQLEGTYSSTGSRERPSQLIAQRNLQVFQHPDRLPDDISKIKRYIKNYDVYSLGVILLQIGIWEPISTITRRLGDDSAGWPERLCAISQGLGLTMSNRYQRVVAWCLGMKGGFLVKDSEFAQEVLDPLEDMANALA